MQPTAEERASDLVRVVIDAKTSIQAEAACLACLREAENAAFERAALHAEDCITRGGVPLTGSEVADAIRNLKHPQADAETGK